MLRMAALSILNPLHRLGRCDVAMDRGPCVTDPGVTVFHLALVDCAPLVLFQLLPHHKHEVLC